MGKQITREVHLVSRPQGMPTKENFSLVTAELPELGPNQVLVRTTWMSVDPYMRGRMKEGRSYVDPFELGAAMDGGALGEVIESNSESVPVGATVMHGKGWREHAIVDATSVRMIDIEGIPAEAFLGPLGGPGRTAYVGLTRIAPVKQGDIAFISGAAGAVGLAAARVARHLGASKIIGSAGGPQKSRRLVEEFGYDVGLDYRLGDIQGQLAAAAPDGIDIYFDNVGADHLEAALHSSRDFARFALCGAIANYNAEGTVPGPTNLSNIVTRRLSLRGFIVSDHADAAHEFEPLAKTWLLDGSLPFERTVFEGIENAVDAFLGLSTGINTGKMLVRL